MWLWERIGDGYGGLFFAGERSKIVEWQRRWRLKALQLPKRPGSPFKRDWKMLSAQAST
jgi:hypothetical protein